MQCNYYVDNQQKIELLKKDVVYCALLNDVENMKKVSCYSGIGEYEPTMQEREEYCFSEFSSCPRFKTRIR